MLDGYIIAGLIGRQTSFGQAGLLAASVGSAVGKRKIPQRRGEL
jgi:hypothetical protein